MRPLDLPLPLTETVTPADEAAVAELVGRAAAGSEPVYPIGGGSQLEYGAAPARPGRGLSLQRLGRIIEYPARDLTITAEAGVTVAELGRRLARQSQWLPVDVPAPDRATLGGAVATNLGGPRALRWGTLRDYVIGLRAVDGRGEAFCTGARVVKNAAGYNLTRLLAGSLGTLAVITQVTLMVKPRPAASALVVSFVHDADRLEGLLSELVTGRTLPSLIEVLAGPAWARESGLPRGLDGTALALVVGFEGTRAEVDWMIDAASSPWRAQGVAVAATLRDRAARRLVARLSQFLRPPGGQDSPLATCVEIRLPPGATASWIARLGRWDPEGAVQAHAGTGILRLWPSVAGEAARRLIVETIRPAVISEGGSAVVVRRPPQRDWDREAVWGPPNANYPAMKALKTQFDPHGILNPHRFIFDP